MLDHYQRARAHVEGKPWDALRRAFFAAIAFTALAVAVSGLLDVVFYVSAFLALVLWFVSLGLLATNLQEAATARGSARR